MLDTVSCPVCQNKFKSVKYSNKFMANLNKTSNYIERICSNSDHLLKIIVDQSTKSVDLLKVSLNPKCSRIIEIDFYNKKSRISCLKNSVPEYIMVPKIFEPDFPNLEILKKQVGLFIVFS